MRQSVPITAPDEEFPPDFLWGVATAGYQVEGGLWHADWERHSASPEIRQRVGELSELAGTRIDLAPAGEAVRHADLAVLRADLDRAVALGLNAYRFSIEWARVQPRPPTPDDDGYDPNSWLYYDQVVREVRARGLEPIVTLHHFVLPLWVLAPPERRTLAGVARRLPFVRRFGVADARDPAFRRSLRGWESPQTVAHFLDFVQAVASRYRREVRYWITLNEPVGAVALGYVAGVWPPGFALRGDLARKAYFNLLAAHVGAYRQIKRVYGDEPSAVGIAHALLYAKRTARSSTGFGASWGAIAGAALGSVLAVAAAIVGTGLAVALLAMPAAALLGGAVGAAVGAIGDPHAAARRQFDYFCNQHLLDSLITGEVDLAIQHRPARRRLARAAEYFDAPEAGQWEPHLDFVGINYYRAVYVAASMPLAVRARFVGGVFDEDLGRSRERHGLLNDLGWEAYPVGLRELITQIHTRHAAAYHEHGNELRILVTENGFAEAVDSKRAAYMLAHLAQLRAAIKDGIRVIGYLHWSLIDNFEWHAHYRPEGRFGLYTVDRDRIGQPRHQTEAAVALRHVVTGGGLEPAIARFGTFTPDGAGLIPPVDSAAPTPEHGRTSTMKELDKLPWATMLAGVVVAIVAIVGGAVVLTAPEALTFGEYVDALGQAAVGVGLVAVGRGVAKGAKHVANSDGSR